MATTRQQYAVNELIVSFNTNADLTGTAAWTKIPSVSNLTISFDGNEASKVFLANGGWTSNYAVSKSMSLSLTCEDLRDDTVIKAFNAILYGDVSGQNNRQIKIEWPLQDSTNTKAQSVVLTGVIKFGDVFGGSPDSDTATWNLEFIVSGKPEITAEAA